MDRWMDAFKPQSVLYNMSGSKKGIGNTSDDDCGDDDEKERWF